MAHHHHHHPFSLFDLTGKNAVVTGGSRGMGKEMCSALARAGCNVIITSRKIGNCEELAAQIEKENPGRRAVPYACHVGKWEECDSLCKFAFDTFGTIDILINNAGGSPLYPRLVDITEKYFDSVVGLNLKGPFRLCTTFGSRMCAQEKGGSIINVSTVESVQITPRATVYGAAKAGLNKLTEAIAHAYGPKVRCNCIMPGPFLTDISEAWDVESMQPGWKASSALMRAGRADEIVGAALYFCSEASSFTTGAILRVDGLMGGAGIRDPDHSASLDYDRDVVPLMVPRDIPKSTKARL